MKENIKEFTDDVKDGFRALPEYLAPIIVLCLLVSLFHGANEAINAFLVLLGVWAVIYIAFPFVLLILDIINYVFRLKEPDNK
jgi:hypothetical protein